MTSSGNPTQVKSINASAVSSSAMHISWMPLTDPNERGGLPVGSYVVFSRTEGFGWAPDGILVPGSMSEYVLSGLYANTQYMFRVYAENTKGPGPLSLATDWIFTPPIAATSVSQSDSSVNSV